MLERAFVVRTVRIYNGDCLGQLLRRLVVIRHNGVYAEGGGVAYLVIRGNSVIDRDDKRHALLVKAVDRRIVKTVALALARRDIVRHVAPEAFQIKVQQRRRRYTVGVVVSVNADLFLRLDGKLYSLHRIFHAADQKRIGKFGGIADEAFQRVFALKALHKQHCGRKGRYAELCRKLSRAAFVTICQRPFFHCSSPSPPQVSRRITILCGGQAKSGSVRRPARSPLRKARRGTEQKFIFSAVISGKLLSASRGVLCFVIVKTPPTRTKPLRTKPLRTKPLRTKPLRTKPQTSLSRRLYLSRRYWSCTFRIPSKSCCP